MAIDSRTVHEVRTTGVQTNGSGFAWLSLVDPAVYKWDPSALGTNEYVCKTAAGGNPGLTEAKCVSLNGAFIPATKGVLGSLAASEWGWGDNDGLGYSTVYVRLADGADPDTKNWGFVSMGKGGGIDYTQQDAAQLSLSDIATGGAGTGLSSVTGGLTAQMVYNLVYLTGGGCTAGWYQITAVADTNNCTIDRSAGINLTGVTGNVGGAFALGGTLDDAWADMIPTGNRIFIEGPGTYTLTAAIAKVQVGSANCTTFTRIIGYTTDRTTRALDTNRPTIAVGSYGMAWNNDQVHFENIIFTGTSTNVISGYSSIHFLNCKTTNSSGTAGRRAYYGASYQYLCFCCEGISTNGEAFGDGSLLVACYAHDSVKGAVGPNAYHCVFDTCTTYGVGYESNIIMNCTVYNCGIGCENIAALAGTGWLINNIIHTCTTGIHDGHASWLTHTWFNSIYNCGTIRTYVDLWGGNRFADPELADPGNADFHIDNTSDVFEQALDIMTYIPGVTI